MTDLLAGASAILERWRSTTSFSKAYIFGSLVYDSGKQFDPHVSDVDVICTFRDRDSYVSRWRDTAAAYASVQDLNLSLLKLLRRADASKPIVSLVPVSAFELSQGLHKDKAAQFFSHNDFYCVTSRRTSTIGSEHHSKTGRIEGALDAVREAQRMRNKMLLVAPNGAAAAEDYDGPDVFPKALLRSAAQVRWARDDKAQSSQRVDVNEGLVYALQVLAARRTEHEGVDDLLRRTAIRMGGRGTSGPLSVSDQVLLWEVLADEARGLVAQKPDEAKAPSSPIERVSAETREAAFKRAGYKCSFPGCGVPLGAGGIGEIAQIVSTVPGGARYNARIEDPAAAQLDNLVVLCPTHHQLVDANSDAFPVSMMKGWNEALKAAVGTPAFSARNLFTITKLILELLP